MTKKRHSGNRILKGLKEALDWTKGKGNLQVTFPGEETKEMTF